MTIKACKDCRFCIAQDSKWDFAVCHHESALTIEQSKWHLGEEGRKHTYCSVHRQYTCGKEAKFFEAKE